MSLEISSRKALSLLLLAIGILFALHVLFGFLKFGLAHGSVYGLTALFDFDNENNVPTLYSSVQLLIASALLYLTGLKKHAKTGRRYYWLFLTAIFLFLAIDETSQLHEQLMVPVRNAFQLSGFFYFSWVVPYGIAVLVLIVVFSHFLLELPTAIRIRFAVAGGMFVLGAVGFEMLGARHAESVGTTDLTYWMIYTVEESLEMTAVAYFIYALLVNLEAGEQDSCSSTTI